MRRRTWPLATSVLDWVLASIVPIDPYERISFFKNKSKKKRAGLTCLIGIVIRYICEVEGDLYG